MSLKNQENWSNEKKNISQYYMYGIVLPYTEESAKLLEKNVLDEDDICGIFSGRDGKFIILGRILFNEPLVGDQKPFEVPKLEAVDELVIESLVKQKYGTYGEFHYYFVTNHK